jgi:thioester reductase-like protein
MDIVGVGGAALPAEVGDRLVSQGVSLISRFGSAECGFLLSSQRAYSEDKHWQYLRLAVGAEKYLRFEKQPDGLDGEGLAELIVLPGWPHMAKRNRDDGSYATSDLFAAHPEVKDAWRYHSRADSQLTLITGKKFDPAPLEASLATSDLLEDVLIFGNGRPYPGAFLFRNGQSQDMDNVELLNRIWPQMEKLNSSSQDHATIGKHMLVPMPRLDSGLEKSSKGTILRGAAEKRFAKLIESAYEERTDDQASTVADEDLVEAVRQLVQSVSQKGRKRELTDTTDLFSYGVDSVAGMQIRGKLRRLLPKESNALPINIVEDCGTVERLAQYLKRRRHGEDEQNGGAEDDEYTYMLQLVEDYSRSFTARGEVQIPNGITHRADGEVVVLTGATGALGAHILDQYRQQSSVKKIWCLVRGVDSRASAGRVNKALSQRSLQPVDGDPKVTVLPAVLGQPQLGLDEETYDKLARDATIIMHVAWSVNFRMKLRSFVKDNIAGVTNLIKLALAAPREQPPHFAFCSSVASAMAYKAQTCIPETIIDDPRAATGLGYSQSKWVAEQICQRAAANTKLHGRVSVYRVGQLAGDTVHGAWNAREAWPLMLSAVKVSGSLPDLQYERLDWLPVDLAAKALIQGADGPVKGGELAVYHVLNKSKTPSWSRMLQWLQTREQFDVVEPAQWVEQLEQAVEKGESHPASQLLDHWRQAYAQGSHSDEAGSEEKAPDFEMSQTEQTIPALQRVEPVSEVYFGKLWDWIKTNM